MVVMFDYAKQTSCPVPADVRKKIAAIEGKPFA